MRLKNNKDHKCLYWGIGKGRLGSIYGRIEYWGIENPFKRCNWGINKCKSSRYGGEKYIQISMPNIGISIHYERFKPYWLQYYEHSKYMIDSEHHISMICSDPMNGCPDDFAEDHNRRHRGDEMKYEYLRHKTWKWTRKIADYFLSKHQEKLNQEWDNLPWNQEHEENS